jgi:hypothetical protein
LVLDDAHASGRRGEQRSRLYGIDPINELPQAGRPLWIGRPDKESGAEAALNKGDALQAIFERALVEEQLDSCAERAISPLRPKVHVEQRCGHRALVRA